MTEQDGYFNIKDQRIAIRDDMSEVQTISAVIHEIAHSKLHNPEMEIAENNDPAMAISRRTEEVQAESISFAVCNYYGIKTDENSFGYIASWSKGKELAELSCSRRTQPYICCMRTIRKQWHLSRRTLKITTVFSV